jgi:hypothetical protein
MPLPYVDPFSLETRRPKPEWVFDFPRDLSTDDKMSDGPEDENFKLPNSAFYMNELSATLDNSTTRSQMLPVVDGPLVYNDDSAMPLRDLNIGEIFSLNVSPTPPYHGVKNVKRSFAFGGTRTWPPYESTICGPLACRDGLPLSYHGPEIDETSTGTSYATNATYPQQNVAEPAMDLEAPSSSNLNDQSINEGLYGPLPRRRCTSADSTECMLLVAVSVNQNTSRLMAHWQSAGAYNTLTSLILSVHADLSDWCSVLTAIQHQMKNGLKDLRAWVYYVLPEADRYQEPIGWLDEAREHIKNEKLREFNRARADTKIAVWLELYPELKEEAFEEMLDLLHEVCERVAAERYSLTFSYPRICAASTNSRRVETAMIGMASSSDS